MQILCHVVMANAALLLSLRWQWLSSTHSPSTWPSLMSVLSLAFVTDLIPYAVCFSFLHAVPQLHYQTLRLAPVENVYFRAVVILHVYLEATHMLNAFRGHTHHT